MIEIVYSDEQIVVVSKPPGLPSQPDPTGDDDALTLAARVIGVPSSHRTLHPVHRIDRPASGLLLFARSSVSAARMTSLLGEGAIVRQYWAVVEGILESDHGTLTHRLVHDRRRNRSIVGSTGKGASLSYRRRTVGERYSLVEVTLATGRHHQIRAQLAAVGHPVRGDLKYGALRSLRGGGIMLHAVRLRIERYRHGPLELTAPPPDLPLWHALADGLIPGDADS